MRIDHQSGLVLGIVTVAFAAGCWFGSIRSASAQVPVAASDRNMRYMLTGASDGSMFLVDTSNGETWTLAPSGDTRVIKQWVKLATREPGPRRLP